MSDTRSKVMNAGARLFHGSATAGIAQLARAEETTVGAGVYLADEPTACGYARHRAESGTPVVYEVEVDRLRLVDLTDPGTVEQVMTEFRSVLLGELVDASRAGAKYYVTASLLRTIEDIDKGRVRPGTVKLAAQRCDQLFSDHLRGRGFDGVLALEGGEGEIGNHLTYLVFDPAKVRIREERTLTPSPPPRRVDRVSARVTGTENPTRSRQLRLDAAHGPVDLISSGSERQSDGVTGLAPVHRSDILKQAVRAYSLDFSLRDAPAVRHEPVVQQLSNRRDRRFRTSTP